MGGFFKPIVGVGVADLSTKLPWTPNYIPPQTEVFIPAAVVVEADAETKEEGDDGILPGKCLRLDALCLVSLHPVLLRSK